MAATERDGVVRVLLTGASAGAVAVLLLVVGASHFDKPAAPAQVDGLYNVPNWVHDRTTSHFPQNEANWLNEAAAGRIGDEDKDDDAQGNLTAVMNEWKDRAMGEKRQAMIDAQVKAVQENYAEYNTTLGKALLQPRAPPASSAVSATTKQTLSAAHGKTKAAHPTGTSAKPAGGGGAAAQSAAAVKARQAGMVAKEGLVAPGQVEALAGWKREQDALERLQEKAEKRLKKELKVILALPDSG